MALALATITLAGPCVWPGVSAAAVLSLSPVADTYVGPGAQAGRDHGGSRQLKVQGGARVAYLVFALPALPGPLTQARLMLSPTNASLDGGTVYRIPDTGWVAGTGTESIVGTTGLRFADVDANGDGRLDAADGSPLVPAPELAIAGIGPVRRGRTRWLDVTAAVAGGPGLYAFAIASDALDLAAYASNEHPRAARRPMLEVVTADATPGVAGRALVYRVANRAFDPYATQATPARQAWLREHLWRLLAYPPAFDARLSWFPHAWGYKDLYAVYVGSDLARRHDEWILRDAAGQRLFIPYGCGAGTCPQYAADPGSADFRAQWIAAAGEMLAAGYEGLFIDDVNLFLSRVGNGAGQAVAPVDRRTGLAMTESDWRRYVAEFVEAVRAAFPGVEIVHNAIWYVGDADPFVARQIAAADYQNLERGVNDGGLVGGAGRYGFKTFLGHLDAVHAAGRAFLLDGEGADLASREYSLASYLLAKGERDAISHDRGTTPDDWWAEGWEVDLGVALDARGTWAGVLRRNFIGGLVLVNPPGAPTRTLVLDGAYRDLTGAVVTSVTLPGGHGAVLRAGQA